MDHQAIANNLKDPYFLYFLSLPDTFLEKDLEAVILTELEAFILELGKGFAFVERQKRMVRIFILTPLPSSFIATLNVW